METITVRFPTIRTADASRGTFICEWKDAEGVFQQTENLNELQSVDQQVTEAARQRILDSEGDFEVVVNLRGSSYINSARLGYIMRIRQAAVDKGGEVAVEVTTPQIRDTFGVTKLDKLFDIRWIEPD